MYEVNKSENGQCGEINTSICLLGNFWSSGRFCFLSKRQLPNSEKKRSSPFFNHIYQQYAGKKLYYNPSHQSQLSNSFLSSHIVSRLS